MRTVTGWPARQASLSFFLPDSQGNLSPGSYITVATRGSVKCDRSVMPMLFVGEWCGHLSLCEARMQVSWAKS
jgi:hypothetical protein